MNNKKKLKKDRFQAWWHMPVIPVFWRQRQDREFEAAPYKTLPQKKNKKTPKTKLRGCLTSRMSLSWKPNLGRWEMQKGQQTEVQTCTKLGPGGLGTRMETHQPPPPPVSLLYTVATLGGEAVLRRRG
jgi:hypothetical protein